MTYEEFLDLFPHYYYEDNGTFHKGKSGTYPELSDFNSNKWFRKTENKTPKKNNPIYTKANYIGGMSGGNCWDDTEPSWQGSYDKKEGLDLSFILEKVCPQITYLQYKKIENLIKTTKFTECEYYGNTS